MALSKKAREILEVAMADKKAAKEVADAVDAGDNSAAMAAVAALDAAVEALDTAVQDHEARITALEGA